MEGLDFTQITPLGLAALLMAVLNQAFAYGRDRVKERRDAKNGIGARERQRDEWQRQTAENTHRMQKELRELNEARMQGEMSCGWSPSQIDETMRHVWQNPPQQGGST